MRLAIIVAFAALSCYGQRISGKTSISGRATFGTVAPPFESASPGTSNTQALISYTAPSTNPCAVEVSESPTYSPLVNDVNPALFSGADQDDRAGSLGAGTTSRTFVAGTRTTGLSGATYYSRALQTNTKHYWRATCGATILTGTFTTANIPLGNTRGELIQYDSAGAAVVPTFPNNRTATVIDPQTGILAKRVNIAAEGGLSIYSGGRPPVCGTQLVGPWPGYLCAFLNDPTGALYYVNTTSGATRYLGVIYKGGVYSGGGLGPNPPVIDPSDGRSWFANGEDAAGKQLVFKFTYTGDYSEVSPGTQISDGLTITAVTADLEALLVAYDATYDPTKFSCSFTPGGAYSLIACNRWQQDTYGWMFVMRMSDHAIIAGTNVVKNPKTRWCGNHTLSIVGNTPLVQFIPHGLSGTTELGGGAYLTTLVGNISDTATTITVASQPTQSGSTEPYLMDLAVGDVLIFNRNGGVGVAEYVTITGGTYPTYTVTRASIRPDSYPAHAWSSGAELFADCGANPTGFWPTIWWKFLDDPTATGSGYFTETYMPGSHEDVQSNGRVDGERKGQMGPISDIVNTPAAFQLQMSVAFAGKIALADGDYYSDYPSYQQQNAPGSEQNWFLSEPTYYGVGPAATLISGQLYLYTPNEGGATNSSLQRKHLETLAASGGRVLRDISGPGSVIDDTSAHSLEYCIPNAANECFTGSTIGAIYMNVPGVLYPTCQGRQAHFEYDLCVANLATQGAYQFGFTPNTVGISPSATPPLYGAGYTRRLSTGFGGIKHLGKMFKPTRDGKWGFFQVDDAYMFMVKIPPTPALDGVDRSTFVRAPIPITTPGSLGIATATVEFGYVEYGTVGQHYCTSRREACVVTASTVTDATPFWYVTSEAGSYTRASCASSCTITLPVLPGKVAYYTVKFYDGAGNFVQNGVSGLAMDSIGGAGAPSWSTLTNGQWTGMTNAQWTAIKN